MSSSSPPNVSYQLYRSKRHSQNVSNPYLVPNVSPPPPSRPPVSTNEHLLSEPTLPQQSEISLDLEKQIAVSGFASRLHGIPEVKSEVASLMEPAPQYEQLKFLVSNVIPEPVEPPSPSDGSPSPAPSISTPLRTIPASIPSASPEIQPTNGKLVVASEYESLVGSSSASSSGPSPIPTTTKKVSTFRHVPLRSIPAQRNLVSSPLRPSDGHSRILSDVPLSPRHLHSFHSRPQQDNPSSRASSTAATSLLQPVTSERASPSISVLGVPAMSPSVRSSPQASSPPRSSSIMTPSAPSPRIHSPAPSESQSVSHTPAFVLSPSSSSSSIPTFRHSVRPTAPYRPGFQPKGVYRPRTDEFIEYRRAGRDSSRIERTRLERRLEKLINLHFPHTNHVKEKPLGNGRSSAQSRRQSSFFELTFNDLKTKSAGDLWKEVIIPQPAPGSKADIRSSEQTITPWQDDADVSQCPLCGASFHPLTNRKHHCRLCGQIICSLPVKYPQRPKTCSILFVADPSTSQIEEVGEGVDYGVRRRGMSTVQGKGKGRESLPSDEDKFLKGVRICRECRPVLLRRQYIQEVHRTPVFSKLYDAFVLLEKEIEEALPQFQELLLNLSNEERPAPEASAARKRLLDAFAKYDILAKRIRQLPCQGGQGSSQDRVQMAILSRANLFLQKNMFPLQAIPKPTKTTTKLSKSSTPEPAEHLVDPDSEVAHALQPLLEQEALLESFVEEAKAHRKFEDAKTLKANLVEIRVEIDRMLANAEPTAVVSGRGKQVFMMS